MVNGVLVVSGEDGGVIRGVVSDDDIGALWEVDGWSGAKVREEDVANRD